MTDTDDPSPSWGRSDSKGSWFAPDGRESGDTHISFRLRMVLFALAYFAAAYVSYELSHWTKVANQFWLPSGLLIAAMLLNPVRGWPVLLVAAAIGDGAYNFLTPTPWPLLVWGGAMMGNVLSALLGAWLIRTFVARRPTLSSVRELVGFVVLGGFVGSAISAFIGAAVIRYQLHSDHYWIDFAGWYMSDLLGVTLFGPTVIAWRGIVYGLSRDKVRARGWEYLAMAACIVAVMSVTYYCHLLQRTDVLFVAVPIVTWAALRLGMSGATLAILVATLTSDWFVARGYGPVGFESVSEWRRIVEAVLSQVAFGFVGMLPATVFSSFRAARAREAIGARTMTLLATGAHLPQILDSIIAGVQQQDADMICCIMSVDQTGKRLSVEASLSLPENYRVALNGIPIGPHVGACGKAACLNRRVITEDIATDPDWADFREVALGAGLRSCWAQPVMDSTGHVVGTFSVYHQRPLLPTGQEIDLINAACNVAAIAWERRLMEERLLRRQRLESIGRLAGGIAHDLNNLLTPITICASFLKELGLKEQETELVESIQVSARRGADLVKQVLTFARGVEGSRIALNLELVVAEIESIVAKTFPKNIRFVDEMPDELPLVTGDRTQLGQVVLNLCLNARDAMLSGGVVRLSAIVKDLDAESAALYPGVTPGQFVEVEVADTGTGMTPDVVDRIFEPFFTTKETGRGTGLGLSTALGIVRSHGGYMDVSSRPGHGSIFRFGIPTVGQDSVGASADDAESAPRDGGGEGILLVDDEDSVLDTTARLLIARGYKVFTAGNGKQALRVYEANRGRIVMLVTDLMMPVMDGNALIREIRALSPELPVITVSGLRAESANQLDGRWRHVSKPYTPDQMMAAVSWALETPGAASPAGEIKGA